MLNKNKVKNEYCTNSSVIYLRRLHHSIYAYFEILKIEYFDGN